MNVLIRADASNTLGSGHITRCLSLADSLARQGGNVRFLSRELPRNLFSVIKKRGFQVKRLDGDELGTDTKKSKWDWLIIDHYELDSRWENHARAYAEKIMVIDDFIHRPHDCDVLLNQNFYENPHSLYAELLPDNCQKLIGSRFALLNSTFGKIRKKLRKRDGLIKRILIFFGSSDPTGETEKALQAVLSLAHSEIHWDIVVGENNLQKENIKKICAEIPYTTFHCQTDQMPQLMHQADLALGAGGSTTWERCCMGLPSLLVSTASNQENIAKSANTQKFGVYLGPSQEVTPQLIKNQLETLLDSPEKVLQFSKNASKLVDGQGANRVGEILSV